MSRKVNLFVALFFVVEISCSPVRPKEPVKLPVLDTPNSLDSSQAQAVFVRAQHFPNGTQLSLCIISGDSEKYIGIERRNDSLVYVNNRDSVFEIGSITKTFTGTMLAKLVRDGKVDPNEPIKNILPVRMNQSSLNGKEITLVHLANHTSGLPFEPSNVKNDKNHPFDPYSPYQYYSTQKLYDYLSHQLVLQLTPGEKRIYSNLGGGLLGHILTLITKKTYEELLTDKIFKPLGMTDASASYKALLADKNLALPHFRRDATSFRLTKNSPEYYTVLPAAGVNASISDMTKWLLALLGNNQNVITTTTLNEICKPAIETPRRRKYQFFRWTHLKDAHYGLGWRVLNYGGHTLIYHGGHINGYRSEVAFCPEEKVGIVILTNATGKLANDGVEVFFDNYFGYKSAKPAIETKNAGIDPHSYEAP